MRRRYLSDVYRLAVKALAHGATRVSAGRVRWDISGACQNGYSTFYFARPSRSKFGEPMVVVGPDTAIPMEVEVITPCRQCEPCLRTRARLWRMRASAECELWPRTWFGTITLRPDAHYRFLAEVRTREGAQGVDYDALGEAERLRIIDAAIWRELSLMLKRIRASYAGRMRHLLVCELHKSGLPHYHALIHQCSEEPLLYRHLDGQWPHGFTQYRLVRGLAGANYVSKYLSKSAAARVRASQAYGTPEGVANEMQRDIGLDDRKPADLHSAPRALGTVAQRTVD